jgi:N-acetylneuraminic acid mutarotase
MGSETAITLFGGAGARGNVGDTWTWDGNAWLRHDVPGPSPRYGAAMAPLRGKSVLFGGAGYVNGDFMASDQTYEWDGMSWTLRNVVGPPRRWVHTMAALNDKVVLFGGFDGAKYLGDTWEWDGIAWTQRMVEGPVSRGRHAMTTVKGKVILFGGQTATDTLDDTWEWDGNAWTQRNVSPAPEPRVGHAMAALGDKAVMISGGHAGQYFVDTWEWDGNAWTELALPGPSQRAVPAMATLKGKILLFGGVVNVGGSRYEYLADTWEWDGTTWTERKASGPIGVSDAAMSSR